MPKTPRSRTSGTAKTRAAAKKPAAKARRNWKPAWLKAFREHGTVTLACQAAKVGRSTVYSARADEKFADAWDAVEAETTDAMEREAYRRAVEGVTEPLVSAGKHVTNVQKYSDTLLIFLLKARRPKTYRENVKVEHAGRIDGKHVIEIPDTTDRRSEVLTILAKAGVTPDASRN